MAQTKTPGYVLFRAAVDNMIGNTVYIFYFPADLPAT